MKLTYSTLLSEELKALRRAEIRLGPLLRSMGKTAFHSGLVECLAQRSEQCAEHLQHIAQANTVARHVPPWRERDLFEVFTAPGEGEMDTFASPAIVDLALIGDVLRISHYLVSRYRHAVVLGRQIRRSTMVTGFNVSVAHEAELQRKLLTLQGDLLAEVQGCFRPETV